MRTAIQRTAVHASAHCSSQLKYAQVLSLPARPTCAGWLGSSGRVPVGCPGLRRGVQRTVRQRRGAVVRAEYGDETHWGVPEDSYLVLVRAPCLRFLLALGQLLCLFMYALEAKHAKAIAGPGALLPKV